MSMETSQRVQVMSCSASSASSPYAFDNRTRSWRTAGNYAFGHGQRYAERIAPVFRDDMADDRPHGKGAWRDNIFVERLWRTIKYEEVYLRAYANVPEARASIGRYIDGFYNARRPIRALTGGRRMRPTSLHCSQSRLQHNHGRNPLSRSQPAVQTNRATSHRMHPTGTTLLHSDFCQSIRP